MRKIGAVCLESGVFLDIQAKDRPHAGADSSRVVIIRTRLNERDMLHPKSERSAENCPQIAHIRRRDQHQMIFIRRKRCGGFIEHGQDEGILGWGEFGEGFIILGKRDMMCFAERLNFGEGITFLGAGFINDRPTKLGDVGERL